MSRLGPWNRVVERSVQRIVEPKTRKLNGTNHMKKFNFNLCLLGGALFISTLSSHAVLAQPDARAAKIFVMGGAEKGPLPADWHLADAVSLNADLEQMAPDSSDALQNWVRDGGVVFLHTDAAQMFGYQTVPARIGTPQVAGQLYGRARAALPAPAYPLLWGAPDNNQRANDGSPGSLGVEVVYYRMQPGDVLVTSNDVGVPLLEVTDLAVADNGPPLYAAAIAPYGRGWAVFTPDFIETERADGALFARNLAALASNRVRPNRMMNNDNGAPPDADLPRIAPGADAMAALPAALLDTPNLAPDILLRGIDDAMSFAPRDVPDDANAANANAANANAANANAANANAANANAANANAANANAANADKEQRVLMLSRGELTSLAQMARGAANDAATGNALRATLALLQARLELQRMAPAQAARLVDAAAKIAPQSAEVALWDGILNAARAADRLQSSRDRALAWRDAAAAWNRALQNQPLWNNAQTQKNDLVGGVDRRQIDYWRGQAGRAAALAAVEPPLVTPLGRGRETVLLRHYPNDPTLRYALPFGQYLATSTQRFGWHAPDEEILIFPSERQLQTYRAAADLTDTPFPNPLARYGDIQGTRILMVSQASIPVILPARAGQPPRVLNLGTSVPAVLSRFHAQILVNSLAQDGAPIPNWISYGLISLATGDAVNTGAFNTGTPLGLNRFARAGILLTPRQFDQILPPGEQSSAAEAQAASLMTFFYARFGPGAVAQTLQRLGSGENINSALDATTQLNEEGFFRTWAANIAP